MATWHEIQAGAQGTTYREKLSADERCTLSEAELDRIFDPWSFLGRIDVVFDRLQELSFE